MRKTFKFICAAVVAAFAVSSCYDDALVWDELDKHAGEIAGLEERVAALETKLNSEVAAINKVVSTLQGNVTALQGDVKDLTAADAELLSKLNGLSSEDKKLTDALAGLQAVVDAMAEPVDSLADVTTAIQESIKEALEELDALDGTVDGAVTDFEKALATLEKTLKDADAANLAAVQAAIAALDVEGLAEELDGVSADLAAAILTVAVVDVEKLDNGDIVLTLKDNTTLTIPAKDENANNESLVTTVTVDGVVYWAVVGEDGEATVIVDGEGNKIPVGHPIALEFRMGNSGTLEYSTDGGQTFTDTGLSASVPDLTVAVVKNFVDNDSYVSMTIGGVAVNLPKYVAEDLSAELSRENMFVSYGSSKTVELTVADATEYYVMAKPDGWKAKFDENVLTVTAPSKKAAEADAAELEGEILVHANTASGKCTVVKLDVKTGVAVAINIDSEGNLEVFNALTDVRSIGMYEEITFANLMLGVVPAEVFDTYENAGEYFEAAMAYEAEFEMLAYTQMYAGEYVEGEYEEDIWEVSLEELCAYIEPFEAGSKYAFVAIPQSGQSYLFDDATYCYYNTPVEVTASATSTTFNEIVLNLSVKGADNFYVGITTQKYMGEATVDEYMLEQYTGPFGFFKFALQMGQPSSAFDQMGIEYENTSESHSISLTELNEGPLEQNTKYHIWVFPVVEGKDLDSYVYEKDFKPYIFDFSTSALTAGGTATVIFDEEPVAQTYTSVNVSAELSDDATMAYYFPYDPEVYNEMSGDAVVADLLKNGIQTSESNFTMRSSDNRQLKLNAGSPVLFAVLAVDSEGKYGTVVGQSFKTKELVINNDLNATITASAYTYTNTGGSKYTTVYLKVETDNSNLKSIRYFCDLSSRFNVDQNALAYSTGSEQSVTYLTNGYFKLTYKEAGAEYKLGYVCIDTDGCASEYKEITFTTPADNSTLTVAESAPAVSIYNPDGKSFTTTGSINKVTISYNIPDGAMAWIALNNDVNVTGEELVRNFVTGNYTNATWVAGSASKQYMCGAAKTGYKFYFVMMDASGNLTYYVEDIDAYITEELDKLQ